MDGMTKDTDSLKLADKEPKKPNRFTFNIGASEFVPSWGPPAEEQVVFQPAVSVPDTMLPVAYAAVKTPTKNPTSISASVTPEPSSSAPTSKPSTPPAPKEKGTSP